MKTINGKRIYDVSNINDEMALSALRGAYENEFVERLIVRLTRGNDVIYLIEPVFNAKKEIYIATRYSAVAKLIVKRRKERENRDIDKSLATKTRLNCKVKTSEPGFKQWNSIDVWKKDEKVSYTITNKSGRKTRFTKATNRVTGHVYNNDIFSKLTQIKREVKHG